MGRHATSAVVGEIDSASPLDVLRCDRERWTSALSGVAGTCSTPFHSWEWCCAHERLPGMSFIPVVCTDRGTGASWLVPLFVQDGTASASVFGYGGPVALNGVPMRTDALDIVSRTMSGLPLHRMSVAPDAPCVVVDPSDAAWSCANTFVATLDPDFERFWQRIDGAARTAVRYGRRRGVVVERLADADWVVLARWQNELLIRNGASYQLPSDFLIELRDTLPAGTLEVVGAYLDGDLVGASVFMRCARTIYYWLHVASTAGRRLQVQDGILEAALRSACERGCQQADLGTASTAAHVPPKRRWGAVEIPTHTFVRGARC